MGTDLEKFCDMASSYRLSPINHFRDVDGVKLFLLMGNVTQSSYKKSRRKRIKLDSYAINTMSLVVVLEFNGFYYVVTGDATGATIAESNKIMARIPNFRTTYLPVVAMLTMPHHGSEVSMFNLLGSKSDRENPLAQKNVKNFADYIQAKTITSSAERVRRFKHPSAYLC